MPASNMSRYVNPRLGTYYEIVTSIIVALALVLLMLEQLGYSDKTIAASLMLGLAGLFVAVAVLTYVRSPEDYFAAGRRVPSFFNGLVLCATTFGSVGLVAITGALFAVGFDALAIGAGFCLGLLLMAVLLFPYLRKYGGYTVPAYLGRRYRSRGVRLAASLAMIPPAVLILAAEYQLISKLLAKFLGLDQNLAGYAVFALAALCVGFGGMRSLTWSSSTQAITMLIGLLVPVTIVALVLTNLPIAQLTYGALLERLSEMEAANGLARATSGATAGLGLPGSGLVAPTKPYLQAFSSLSVTEFFALICAVMFGVAAMPSLLVRATTTPSVYEARRSLGWAVSLVGLVVLTLPAIAVFVRYLFFDSLIGTGTERVPGWLINLVQLDLAAYDPTPGKLAADGLQLSRDVVLLVLPMLAGLPKVVMYLALASVAATALTAISARLWAIASMLTEDLFVSLGPKLLSGGKSRLMIARLSLVAVTLASALLARQADIDPVRLMLWSLAIASASGLPVLVMSIWWKRLNGLGALTTICTGAGISISMILLSEISGRTLFGIDPVFAGLVAMPPAIICGVCVSLVSGKPDREVLNFVREIRVPGGETIFDREVRISTDARR